MCRSSVRWLFAFGVCLIACSLSSAQSPPRLVDDLTTTSLQSGSFPTRAVKLDDDRTIFVAADADNDSPLWVHSASTNQITPVLGSVVGKAITGKLIPLSPSRVFFTTLDAPRTLTFWTSDGTTQGTLPSRSFNAAPSLLPRDFVRVRDRLVFVYDTVDAGAFPSLWSTDGTSLGTYRLLDFVRVTSLVSTGNFAVLTVQVGGTSLLCITDGTAEGTFFSSAIEQRVVTGVIAAVELNGRIIAKLDFVSGTGFLSLSPDLTQHQVLLPFVSCTSCPSVPTNPSLIAVIGNVAVLAGDVPLTSPRLPLYRTDGTTQGTSAIAPSVPLTSFVSISSLTALGNRVIVNAGSLWSTDATDIGTILIPGTPPPLPTNPFPLLNPRIAADRVWFDIRTQTQSLLTVDPITAIAATVPLNAPRSRSSHPRDVAGRTVFAIANVAPSGDVTCELRAFDPTSTQLSLIVAIPNISDESAARLALLGSAGSGSTSKLFYSCSGDGFGGEPTFISTATPSTPVPSSDLFTATDPSSLTPIAKSADSLVVLRQNRTSAEIWIASGARLRLLRAFPNVNARPITQFSTSMPLPARAYVALDSTTSPSTELWTTDGSDAGTLRIETTPTSDSRQFLLGTIGSRSILRSFTRGSSSTPPFSTELLVTEGTLASTTTFTLPLLILFDGVCYRDSLYFQGGSPGVPSTIHQTDGTQLGTVPLVSANSVFARPLFTFADRLYFTRTFGIESTQEPFAPVPVASISSFAGWSSTSSYTALSTQRLLGIISSANTFSTLSIPAFASSADQLTSAAGGVFFSAEFEPQLNDLWFTDATAAGTNRLLSGTVVSPSTFASLNHLLAFQASSTTRGREPWTSDSTPQGTRPLADLNPGPRDSFPTNFHRVGNLVYFTAADRRHGNELFAFSICRGDFNLSGAVNITDVLDFLTAYFTFDPRADLTADAQFTTQDVFAFLDGWFTPCQ